MAYRILIVDDEAALQNMVKEILTQAGYETTSALTCAQALEQFRAAAPDAVLLDVNLPDELSTSFPSSTRPPPATPDACGHGVGIVVSLGPE